jgi:hypothetical protein
MFHGTAVSVVAQAASSAAAAAAVACHFIDARKLLIADPFLRGRRGGASPPRLHDTPAAAARI